jgi:hypothetical protein
MPCFAATGWFEEQNTLLYRLINAVLGGLTLAHERAAEVDAARPGLAARELQAAVFPGLASLDVRLDVRPGLINRSRDQNFEAVAQLLLIAVIARYEAWLDQILSDPQFSLSQNQRKSAIKGLQFPTAGTFGQTTGGVGNTLASLRSGEDAVLGHSLRAAAHRRGRTSVAELDGQLALFRLYKEMRNALTHAGGTADHRLADASVYAGQLTAAHTGLKALPATPAYAVGDTVRLTIRDAVLLDALLRRTVQTLDSELIPTAAGESVIIARCLDFRAAKNFHALPSEVAKRRTRVRRFMRWAINTPTLRPTDAETDTFEGFLRACGIV